MRSTAPTKPSRSSQQVIADNPKDTEAIIELGNIQRGRKDFAGCADTYSKAIDTVPNPEKSNWVMFYFRGICYERSHQWPAAEADMKKALELYPDQPLVLNYLGYSWVDQGMHLDEGMDMIRKAVEQRPDDGYIVNSLGWAYFRTGNYDDAVKNLERAVELKPEDPTINDHLGDAYWRVGRTLEAHFQWSHAKDLKPEPEDLPKIEAKLKDGLPSDTLVRGRCQQTQSGGRRRQSQFRGRRRQGQEIRQRRMRGVLARSACRERAGQSQSDAAGARPPRRRLSRDFESLVVFADCGDRLSLTPGGELALTLAGPRAPAAGAVADNLVLKAARALAGAHPRPAPGCVPSGEGICRSRRGLAAVRPTLPRRCGCWRGRTIWRPTIRASTRRRAQPAPTCRSVSIRARG